MISEGKGCFITVDCVVTNMHAKLFTDLRSNAGQSVQTECADILHEIVVPADFVNESVEACLWEG